MDLKSAALKHAALGRYVFPVSWGKIPQVKWSKAATTDPATVAGWWEEMPTAMIGVATGPSGLFVLDVDCKKGARGMETLQSLAAVYGDLPETLTARTASGGLHFYFRLTPRLEQATIRASAEGFDGIDWRGKGGYVVAPPSANDDGQWVYEVRAPIVDMPSEWVDAILEACTASRERTKKADGTGKIPDGQRDDTLFRIGASYRAQGASQEEVLERLLEVNAERCIPPLLPGQVEKIAESASKYDPTEQLTDQGNGQRLAAMFKGRALFVDALNLWHEYDGRVWNVAHSRAPIGWAQELTRSMRLESAGIADEEKRKLVHKFALASESVGKVRAMIDCAAQPDLLGVSVTDLDADPWTWNMTDATLTIAPASGAVEFREHRASDLLTKIGGASGRPAECQTWLAHLERVQPDPEERDYFQRAIGYTLEPGQKEKVLHVVHGPKDSGKSLTINTLTKVFGSYAVTGDLGAFAPVDGGGKNTPQLAALRGARLVVFPEIPRGKAFDSAIIKRWTGGDPMTATPKFGHQFTFQPEGKLLFTGNELPKIHATDDATWRRLRVVGFSQSIPEHEQDPRLGEKFNLDGVWAWIVEGFLAYRAEGLAETAAMRLHRERQRDESNPTHEFVSECLERAPGSIIRGKDMDMAFRGWCREEGVKPVNSRDRAECLGQLGVLRHRTNDGNVYRGWRFTGTGRLYAGLANDAAIH